jgi:hypothetical protein
LMFGKLAMKIKFAAKQMHTILEVQESESSKSLIDEAHSCSELNVCFHKWRNAINERHKTSFLEILFRCGEISRMRRHFGKWKQVHQ